MCWSTGIHVSAGAGETADQFLHFCPAPSLITVISSPNKTPTQSQGCRGQLGTLEMKNALNNCIESLRISVQWNISWVPGIPSCDDSNGLLAFDTNFMKGVDKLIFKLYCSCGSQSIRKRSSWGFRPSVKILVFWAEHYGPNQRAVWGRGEIPATNHCVFTCFPIRSM